MSKLKNLEKQLEDAALAQKTKTIKLLTIEDFQKWGYEPNEEQLKIHKSLSSFKLLVGAPRSGKTATMIVEILMHLLKYPGARGYLSRQHETEFKKTIFGELNKWVKKIPQIREHIKKESKVVFENESELIYGGLWQAEEKLKGLEISIFGADQIEEMEEIVFKTLASRLSLPILERKGLMTCNLGIPEWARKRFIENPEIYHKYFSLYPQNNKFLPDDYLEKQRKVWGDEYFEAMLACDLDYIRIENNVFERGEIKEAFQREKVLGERMIGCDPARGGADECIISEKVGNHLEIVEAYRKKDTNYTVKRLKKIAGDKETKIFIDMGSFGAGIYDRLKEENYNVIGVDFSTSPDDKRKYNLRKAEVIFKLKEDLVNLSITPDSLLEEQMRNVRYKILGTEKIAIETVEERRKRGLKSYDRLMSIALANLEEAGEKEFEIGEDEKGVYEINKFGQKLYFKYVYYNLDKMIRKGRIGFHEATLTLEYLEKNQRELYMSGQISSMWREKRKEFYRYWERYKKSGEDESFIYKKENYRY